MARRKAELTGKKNDPAKASPSSSSASYTESPVSAAAKKASPEVKKAPEKKENGIDYFMKKDRAAKGLDPEEDDDDSEISDSEESKDLKKDPAIARM